MLKEVQDLAELQPVYHLTHTHLTPHSLVVSALEYFLQLTSEMHREAWTPVLLLCFTKILQLHQHQVHPSHYHTVTSHCHTITLSHCPSYYHTITPSHYHTVTSHCHYHTVTSYYHTITPSHYHTHRTHYHTITITLTLSLSHYHKMPFCTSLVPASIVSRWDKVYRGLSCRG